MTNKMVDNTQNKVQKKCFIKKVGDTDYFDEEGNVKNHDVHLIFETKQDYNKIRLINKMFKIYFVLEEKYYETKKYLLKEHLKEIILKLEELDEMIVLTDQGIAFRVQFKNEFKYIGNFLDNRMKLKLPTTPDLIEYLLGYEEVSKEDQIKNKKYYKYIKKVVKLLEEKIYLR